MAAQAQSEMQRVEHSYEAGDITVLEGLEAVRKRPGMYIGSTSERGLHHLVYEVVDNSVDEALAGHADTIHVTLQKDGGVRVEDNGRGIPVAMHPTENKPTVEVVMTVLHAGGKFGGGGYAVSGGLHGVGISVVNALSERVHVGICRDGYLWDISFKNGGMLDDALQQGEPTNKNGTTLTFYPDPEIFDTTVFDFETLRARFQQMAFLNKGLRITLTDEREDVIETVTTDEIAGETENETLADAEAELQSEGDDGEAAPAESTVRRVDYMYENGLLDYVTHLNTSKRAELIHEDVIAFDKENTDLGMSIEVAMQWTTAYSESVHTYANTINTHEGGTHEEGFRGSLTSLINRYAREKQILREKDENLTGDDIREGLTAVISVKLAEPQFEGQTKTKLGNSEARGYVYSAMTEQLGDWLESHPAPARDIIRKSQLAAQARMAARKAREQARRKSPLESFGMPGKLSDCSSKDPEESEIYIVEGDSAGGSAKQGRDPRTQAILPLRGKILNVERARIDRALGNAEVQAMITAFGSGIGEEFDITKSRYHKIVLMADADVDGQHITTLLLTLLFRYMRPLIEHGYVYLAQPPLYKIKWSNQADEHVFTDDQRDEALARGEEKGWRLPKDNAIQRYKGLGEMDYQELWETTMDPEQRTLLQVTMDDAAAADQVFSMLMGEDVESRRNFIQENAKDVRFLDI
ncbi:MAG: DNA topoisomerase (ATP-hydrolyzing) subunit B [Yaniella sp.]|uniref:DNA topoisomerase (ATP-hydrolyzing) subunit B n=1 Tax=Yaniella sp. TaxID=2773929 RepID=UPI002649AC24|nr:DNA topoisomerase (ATP-hydrolyzing) subunit B [Yaniella sp.]MDN5704268.1 DNA topoisomerase (ATP-hydrolyzing) subunit B [Yaniella sp.]MDN5730716.1 DNA topoisomerase (ATP-hydrolyzing) subunit B [Yaniella sp.]MDN5742513.1 DNA topoisomerase (ATP-hydrolyzing) subunit B [Yaniella sp.]MDN5816406.1 DNA topoisomerase (ATP-hydrolyzing) subunit B [Yaniella sp.]MDN5817817.1 DNA topoisomerase (ATP-hydrolyzing) subunit B [Yaniella sp.]